MCSVLREKFIKSALVQIGPRSFEVSNKNWVLWEIAMFMRDKDLNQFQPNKTNNNTKHFRETKWSYKWSYPKSRGSN